jgi:hypothetical protein
MMAAASKISASAVRRIWKAHGLQPHRYRNCSRGWHADGSGDGELAIDEGADCVPVRLSLQACGAGDGSISGVDLGAPA